MIDVALLCLTLNVYHEARGESLSGQFAVAHVTLNRAKRKAKNVCRVVYQKGQFSWVNDQLSNDMSDKKAKTRAMRVAFVSLLFSHWDITRGATYYHTKQVNPIWSGSLVKLGIIGNHVLYKESKHHAFY